MLRLTLLALAACTSTHRLADLADPRLRMAEHGDGFVVHHQRVDPNSTLRFRDGHGRWTEAMSGRDVYVDGEGVWIERIVSPADVVDAVRIDGISDETAARIEDTRPIGARVERDGNAWVLSAPRSKLARWLPELAPEGTWSFSSHGGPFQDPLHGATLDYFVQHGRTMRVGWRWQDIADARVENISGEKTLAAVVAGSVVGVALAPFLILGGALPLSGAGHASGSGSLSNLPAGGGGSHDATPASWAPDLAPPPSIDARPLFSTGANVRSIVRPVVALDASSTIHRDVLATGVAARLRFADIFEIGGGVREARVGGTNETVGVFQTGFHLPLDAGYHYAIPLGFEVSHGGDVAYDLRIPWGLRYTSGGWFATVLPATPQYLHVHDQPRRWSLASGVELGTSF